MAFCLSIVTVVPITRRCIEYVLGLGRERVFYWQQLKDSYAEEALFDPHVE